MEAVKVDQLVKFLILSTKKELFQKRIIELMMKSKKNVKRRMEELLERDSLVQLKHKQIQMMSIFIFQISYILEGL